MNVEFEMLITCSQGTIIGVLCGWIVAMVLGIGTSFSYPYGSTLPTSTAMCAERNLTIVKDLGEDK